MRCGSCGSLRLVNLQRSPSDQRETGTAETAGTEISDRNFSHKTRQFGAIGASVLLPLSVGAFDLTAARSTNNMGPYLVTEKNPNEKTTLKLNLWESGTYKYWRNVHGIM